jgi:8-oxo-dGTP diphosphatase
MRGKVKFCPRCGKRTVKKDLNGIARDCCDSCGEVFYDNPLCAVAVVAEKGGKVIFIKRNVEPAKGMWALPGGFIEQGETVEEAALRELNEETGVSAEKAEIIKVASENTFFFRTLIIIGVRAYGISGELKAGDDAGEVKWCDIGKTPKITFPAHKIFVREVIKEKNKS